MKIATLIARVLLGLGFVVFGLNILHAFLPMPPMDPNALTTQYFNVVGTTHWMTVIGLFQFLGGLMLLSGCMAPLGLAFLAPILVNILCFHLFLDGGHGLAPGLVFSLFEIFLIYAYRSHFMPLFTCKAKPN